MTPSFSKAPSTLDRNFGWKWILGNGLGYGIGISLPILLADLLSAQNYDGYFAIAFLSFGLWAGFAQWLVLRQVMPISARWIFVTAIAPGLSAVLPIILMLTVSPLALLLFLLIYPLVVTLGQWRLLRQMLRPAHTWITTSLLAMVIGGIFWTIGDISTSSINGVSLLISGLSYGVAYGWVTSVELRRLVQQSSSVTKPNKPSRLDIPPGKQPWQTTVLPTLMLSVTFALWFYILPPFSEKGSEMSDTLPIWIAPAYFIFVAYGYVFFSILVHELGHLFFALSHGFELQAFAVDRWVLSRHGQGWRIGKTNKRYAGGFVLPIPKSLKVFSRRSLIIMILGGPVASFLLFCATAVPLLFQPALSHNIFLWFLAFVAAFNLHAAIFNALPLTLGYLRTDGQRILDLVKNNPQGQRFFALYSVNASLRQGIRPREFESSLLERVLAIPEESADHIAGLLVAYDAALDRKDLEQASSYLDQALDMNLHFPEIFRGLLLLEGAYFEAHIRHRADVARAWLGKIQEKALIAPYSLFRAEAAVLLAEDNPAAALVQVQQGLASVQRDRLFKGSAVAEEEYLLALMQEIDERAKS